MQLQEFLNNSSGISNLPGLDYLMERLAGKLSNLQNIVLVAHKGWGKYALIREIGFRITEDSNDIRVFYYDMKGVFDRSTFIRTFIRKLFNSLSADIPDVIYESQPGYKILDLVESVAKKQGIKLIIFITNFDQIKCFNENFQDLKLLRFILTRKKNCAFCICGSNQPLFEKLFSKAFSPMKSFGRVFFLKRRQTLDYSTYVRNLFFRNEKHIEHQAAKHIANLAENHHFYLNLLSWHAYILTDYTCSELTVNNAFRNMMAGSQPLLQHQMTRLSAKQYFYLCAVASGQVELCSREVLEKYKLGSSSNVARIRENLLAKELIEITREHVLIVDPLLKHYILMQIRSHM